MDALLGLQAIVSAAQFDWHAAADQAGDVESAAARIDAERPDLVVEVARQPETFELQLDQIQQTVTERTKLIIVGSPNNPTGNVTAPSQIAKLLENRAIIVVDESFYEFAGTSAAGLVGEFDNLVILRSFSHWAGLAGLRIGYGAFPKWLMPTLWKSKQPYNVNVAASVAAQASLANVDELKVLVEKLKDERTRLLSALTEIPYLKPYPTQSNFILCQVDGRDAADRGRRSMAGPELPKLKTWVRFPSPAPDGFPRAVPWDWSLVGDAEPPP